MPLRPKSNVSRINPLSSAPLKYYSPGVNLGTLSRSTAGYEGVTDLLMDSVDTFVTRENKIGPRSEFMVS